MALSKGVYSKDDCGRLTIKESNHKRRSKQNSYHVMNKNVAPSSIPMDCRRKRGCHLGHPQSQTLGSYLNITLACLGNPQAQGLATPYSFIHRDLTQNLKTLAHKTQQKSREIRQYNKQIINFRYYYQPIHTLFLHNTYCVLNSP